MLMVSPYHFICFNPSTLCPFFYLFFLTINSLPIDSSCHLLIPQQMDWPYPFRLHHFNPIFLCPTSFRLMSFYGRSIRSRANIFRCSLIWRERARDSAVICFPLYLRTPDGRTFQFKATNNYSTDRYKPKEKGNGRCCECAGGKTDLKWRSLMQCMMLSLCWECSMSIQYSLLFKWLNKDRSGW